VPKVLGIEPPHFSQATIVVGTLLAAWVLWLLANNKLGTYWSILLGSGGQPTPSASYPGGTTTTPSTTAPAAGLPTGTNAPAGQAPFVGAIP